MTKNDGGPAFPIKGQSGIPALGQLPGMSMRDYFAAAALQGVLASPTLLKIGDTKLDDAGSFAEWAYMLADSMLAERTKNEERAK